MCFDLIELQVRMAGAGFGVNGPAYWSSVEPDESINIVFLDSFYTGR